MIDLILYFTYFLFIVATGLLSIFLIIRLIRKIRKSRITLIMIGIGIFIIIVSYFLSDSKPYELFDIDASLSKKIGTSLIVMYFLFCLSILSVFFSEFLRLKK